MRGVVLHIIVHHWWTVEQGLNDLGFMSLIFRLQNALDAKCNNRPFYSCVLSVLAWIESEAGVDLVLIETSLLFLCKCKLVSIRTA